MEKLNFEKNKEDSKKETEEAIKSEIHEILKSSPIFEKMTEEEQEQLINELYKLYYKKDKS